VQELTKREGFIAHCVGVAADEDLNNFFFEIRHNR